jgi:predicted phosphodiesterase
VAHKIGVITDVHGDIDGLRRALVLLENDLQVDEVWCNGDLVDKGPNPQAVIALIRERGIPTVMGNHDAGAPLIELELRRRPELRGFYDTSAFDDAEIDFLRALPATRTFERAGVSVMVAHGTPWSHSTYTFSNALSRVVQRVLHEAETDMVLLGHTHEPMVMLVGGEPRICNSGSVIGIYGHRHNGVRSCAVLDLPSREFTVYDIDTAQPIEPVRVKRPGL